MIPLPRFPILAAKWYYEYYGTTCMIEMYYDADCGYMAYLEKKLNEDGFIAHGLGDWGNPQIIGFPSILRVLEENGYQDLIWQKAMLEEGFSYYHFVQIGETALGEYWEDNPRSHNHDMMGSLLELYYSSLAGIKPLEPGFQKVSIKPHLTDTITQLTCTYHSIQGEILVDIHEDKVVIGIPEGMAAQVDLRDIQKDFFGTLEGGIHEL